MAPMNRAERWRHRLWENSWGLQRYKVKKPVKKAIFDFGIADSGLNILNPHKRGAVGGVGAVEIRLMGGFQNFPRRFPRRRVYKL